MHSCLIEREVDALKLEHEKFRFSIYSLHVSLAVSQNAGHTDHCLDALSEVPDVIDASAEETLNRLEPFNMHLRESASHIEHLHDSNGVTILINHWPNDVVLEVLAPANVVDIIREVRKLQFFLLLSLQSFSVLNLKYLARLKIILGKNSLLTLHSS